MPLVANASHVFLACLASMALVALHAFLTTSAHLHMEVTILRFVRMWPETGKRTGNHCINDRDGLLLSELVSVLGSTPDKFDESLGPRDAVLWKARADVIHVLGMYHMCPGRRLQESPDFNQAH